MFQSTPVACCFVVAQAHYHIRSRAYLQIQHRRHCCRFCISHTPHLGQLLATSVNWILHSIGPATAPRRPVRSIMMHHSTKCLINAYAVCTTQLLSQMPSAFSSPQIHLTSVIYLQYFQCLTRNALRPPPGTARKPKSAVIQNLSDQSIQKSPGCKVHHARGPISISASKFWLPYV